MGTINSSLYKNLFFTYALSGKVPSIGTVILLDGLPSNPLSKNQLTQKLAEQNYDVFFPRYEGTWESKGEFLGRAPSEAIIEFIEALKKGTILGDKKYQARKVFVLGSSFGGGVGLDIATKYSVGKICVTSPVISFRKVKGIETLGDYLKNSQIGNYRFDSKKWQKLIKDELWDLDKERMKGSPKILMVTGENDDQIDKKDVIEFGKKISLKLISVIQGTLP